MEDHSRTDQKQSGAAGHKLTSIALIALSIITAIRQPKTHRVSQNAEDERKAANEAALVRHASRTAWATIFIAFASALTFGAAVLQYLVFNAQLGEMRSGSADTHALAQAAVDQAKASQSNAKATEDSARTAHDSMIASQRAWYGPTIGQLDQPVADKAISGKVVLTNSGREPATSLSMNTGLLVFPSSIEPQANGAFGLWAKDCLSKGISPGGVAYPNAQYTLRQTSLERPENKSFAADLLSGNGTAFLFGCIIYQSQGGVRHSAFCFRYKKDEVDLLALDFCSQGNNAD